LVCRKVELLEGLEGHEEGRKDLFYMVLGQVERVYLTYIDAVGHRNNKFFEVPSGQVDVETHFLVLFSHFCRVIQGQLFAIVQL
jgi:hypothetical protein